MPDATVRLGYNDTELRAGLARAEGHAKKFAREAKGSLTGIGSGMGGKLSGMFAGLGAAAGLGAIKEMVDEFDRIGDLAKQLDTSAEAVQKIGRMAKLSGSDVESVATALNKTNKALAGGKGAATFRELGIDAASYLKLDADQQIIQLAAAFQKAEANGGGLTATYDLFGKTAAQLLPLLRSNVGELTKMSEAKVLSDEQIQRVQDFNDAWDGFFMTQKAGMASFLLDLGKFGSAVSSGFANMKGSMMWGGATGFTEGFEKALSDGKKTEAAAKDAAKAEREKRAEAKATAEMLGLQATLAAEKAQTEDDELELVGKLTKAREKVRAMDEEIARVRGAGKKDTAESLAIEIEREKAVRSMKAAERDYNEEVKKTTKAEEEHSNAIGRLSADMKVLELQAQGKNKQAAALQREIGIREEGLRLAKETGKTEEQGIALARRKADLSDRAAKHAERKPGQVRGYHQEDNRFTNPFRGLDSMKRGSGSDFFARNQRTPGLDEHKRLNSWVKDERGHMVRPDAFARKARKEEAAKDASKTLEQIMREVAANTAELKDK